MNPDLSVEVADVDAVYEAVRATGAEAVVLEDGGSRAGLIEMQDPAVGWHRIKDDWATEPGPTMRSMARVDPVVGAFG
ncbi:hypothetical protein [Micromonospora echinofusca]|uniref:hypothetical protein n=1 Tax=Micromonospora echinofusca TaxID=47858 RepID=UPI0033EACAE2